MAVRILKRQYEEFYKSEIINWLLGNTGDWQKLNIQIEADISFIGSNSNSLEINYINNAFVLLSGEGWNSLGFDSGMLIDFSYDLSEDINKDGEFEVTTTVTRQYTISNIDNDNMYVDETIQADEFEMIPTNFGTRKVSNVKINAVNPIEGAVIAYGHISNEDFDTGILNSIIDGSETRFSLPNINAVATGVYQDMEPIGIQSGMSVRLCQFRKVDGFSTSNNVFLSYNMVAGVYRNDSEEITGVDNDFDYITLPITTTPTGDYQSVPTSNDPPISSEGTPSIAQTDCFLHDASSEYTQSVLFNFSFTLVDTNEEYNLDYFSLVILRASGGTNRTFAEEIVIQSWGDARSFLGKKIDVNKIVNLNINQGDSYSLVIKYRSASGDYIDIDVDSGGVMDLSDFDNFFTEQGKQYFECEIEYMISSLFETVDNLDNLIPVSYLQGNGSLTDNIQINLRPVWNNPNILIQNDLGETKKLGNTGWFNENFNELTNDFNVESVVYKNSLGDIIPTLDYLEETTIEVEVSGFTLIDANSRFGIGFSLVPQVEENYKDLTTPFHENLFVSTGPESSSFSISGTPDPTVHQGYGVEGGRLDTKDIQFSEVTGNLFMTCTFVPNVAFSTKIESLDETDRRYLVWLSIADSTTEERNFTNRVSLIVDVGDLDKTVDPAGAYDNITTKFLAHPYLEDHPGNITYDGIVQDDVLAVSNFSITQAQVIEFIEMTFAIELENVNTGEIFNLESYGVDLSQSLLDANGFQVFDVDEERGFKLNSGNNKNFVKIEVDDVSSTPTEKFYNAFYAFKIRYEDWIVKGNVPSDFFDSTKDNEGNHNDWFDYIQNTDWQIKFSNYITAEQNEELILYRTSYDIDFVDYDSNIAVGTDIRYIRDADDSLLNIGADPETGKPLGVILSNELTRIEADFNILDAEFWAPTETYGTITIEIDKGGGIFEMRQISSVWNVEADNPLRPLDTETKLNLTFSNANKTVTTSCLVNPDLLIDAIRYRITARIGPLENGTINNGIYEAAYEAAYE